jgi:hypothetical protein
MNSIRGNRVYYLSASEVVQINDEVTEGHAAIRDLHLLDSALLRPAIVVFGQPQFPTVTEKAAALMESLAYHHLFYDGNKRTAILSLPSPKERRRSKTSPCGSARTRNRRDQPGSGIPNGIFFRPRSTSQG